jgi:Fe-S-cluster containining protein
MEKACESCGGKCCVGEIIVFPSDKIYFDNSLVGLSYEGSNEMVMKTVNNICVALEGGKCSIYDNRPTECMMFKLGSPCCNDFRSGLKTAHSCFPCILRNEEIIEVVQNKAEEGRLERALKEQLALRGETIITIENFNDIFSLPPDRIYWPSVAKINFKKMCLILNQDLRDLSLRVRKIYMQSIAWKKIHGATLRRDVLCRKCKNFPSQQAHHLTYSSLYNELPEHLVGLCIPCHEKITEYERATGQKWTLFP